MNKFELRAMSFAGIIVIIFLFSLLYNAYSRKIDVPSCVQLTQQKENLSQGAIDFKNPGLVKRDDSTFDLYVNAQMWQFSPSEVTVPAGSTVTVYVTSKDVVHGFLVDRKAVNLMVLPGAINTAKIHFVRPGVYRMACHEYCGIGHQSMMGEIVVTEN